jgi:hypothetical protein
MSVINKYFYFIGLFLFVISAPLASARVLFSTEIEITDADIYVIDHNDDAETYIKLQFGNTIDAYLQYNKSSGEFEINKNLNFQQHEAKGLVLETGTSFPAAPLAGQKFFRVDQNSEYVYDGTSWRSTTEGGDADSLDSLDSADLLRSNLSDNYTNGTLTFDEGTTLDVDSATVALDEITNNTLTLDSDNTGGNVILQFGATLNESIAWNNANSRFEVSDDLHVNDNFSTAGNITLGSDTGDTIDVNAAFSDTVHFNQQQAEELVLHQGTSYPDTPIEGQKFYRVDWHREFVYNGTSWVSLGGNGLTHTLVFVPEFPNATLYGDGSNNTGTMAADHDATNNRNFYNWVSTKTVLQDYDVALQIRVPDDFSSWQTTPITLKYITANAANTENKIDVAVKDTAGAVVTVNNGTALANTSWTTALLTFSGSPTFLAGEYFTVFIKMSSKSSNSASIGEIELNYNSL